MFLAPNILPNGLLLTDPAEPRVAGEAPVPIRSSRWSLLRAALRTRTTDEAASSAAERIDSARPSPRWPLAQANPCAD